VCEDVRSAKQTMLTIWTQQTKHTIHRPNCLLNLAAKG